MARDVRYAGEVRIHEWKFPPQKLPIGLKVPSKVDRFSHTHTPDLKRVGNVA